MHTRFKTTSVVASAALLLSTPHARPAETGQDEAHAEEREQETSRFGFLQIVSPSRLEKLHCSMSDALGWPLNWGGGTEAILGKKAP